MADIFRGKQYVVYWLRHGLWESVATFSYPEDYTDALRFANEEVYHRGADRVRVTIQTESDLLRVGKFKRIMENDLEKFFIGGGEV